MTYWVAFDLDQTIGCFESVHPFLTVFFPDVLQQVYRPPYWDGPVMPKLDISTKDKKILYEAFRDFVKWMAVSENKNLLLRPGIIPIISLLLKAKKKGIVGGLMIYSNNSNPYMLHFAHELLKVMIGVTEPIFCHLVHWWHPLRNIEVRGPQYKPVLQLGHGFKTVDTIRKAFSTYPCLSKNVISSSQILFFDDLIHKKISDIIPAQNYFHVQPYHHYGDFDTIYKCFLTALMIHNIDANVHLLHEYTKVGLLIGIEKEQMNSFSKEIHVSGTQNVFDSEVIFKRLSKYLKIDMSYSITNKNIDVVLPPSRPFNKPISETRTIKYGSGKTRKARRKRS